jgi:cyclic dehypoxanthinyl futalosine synthase
MRLNQKEATELLVHGDLHDLQKLADEEVNRRFITPVRTYIVDRNINYTNICTSGCTFCNFCRKESDADSYVLTYDQILQKIRELVKVGGIQILIQGGHHPGLSFEWYLDMLRAVKKHFPQVHIHGFSPPEIFYFSVQFRKRVEEILNEFRQAGLDTIPGGGAEILVDRVRKLTSPGKCLTDDWLGVMRAAHQIGMRTTATMMFGHVETPAERIEHLHRLRDLQDETHGFTAFIPWPFQPTGTRLARDHELHLAGVQDYLKTLAVSRLFLDNFDNIQASWVTQGPEVGQVALKFGANDFGSLMLEENVVAAAGAHFRLQEEELREYLTRTGYEPARRNCYYQIQN